MRNLAIALFSVLFAQFVVAQNSVSITVTDDLGGFLPGISVYAFDGTSYSGKSGTTDSNGLATLDLPNGDFRFRADLNGTQYFSQGANHCATPACSAINMELPRAVSVTVTSSAGGFESGLSIYAFDGTTYVNKSAVTDSNGIASLQLLEGSYRFRIDKNGTQYYSSTSNHCTLPGCTSINIEVPESVTVSVTNGGVPISGLNVYAFNGASYANKSAVTDSNGEAVFTLIAGDYRFRIDKDGTQFFTGASNHCSVPGCNSVSFDIPQSVIVSVTEAGAPATGLNVYAFDGTTYVNQSQVTGANGEAEFVLLAGDYRFRIDKDGTQYFTEPANHCSVPGCSAISFDIPATVSVNVSSSAGGAEQGLSVYAFNGSTYANFTATTDNAGTAEFTLLAGDYRFRIDKNGTQFFTSSSNHCAVPGCTEINYEIPEDITVTVTNSSGSAEAGLNVYAFDGTTYVNKSAVIDSNGEATFTLLPGDYRFRIDKNGTQYFTSPTNNCTAPGCNAVAFEISQDVTITVSNSAGGAEAGLNVYAFNGAAYANVSAVTDVNGEATFTLLDGDYRFRIDKNGTQFFTDTDNHCSLPGCTAINYEIPENIIVTVNGTGGGPEVGLNVYAFDGSTYVNKTAVSDSNGEAVFTLLPGNYRFRIDKNGTQFFTSPVNNCSAPGCSSVSFDIPESVIVSVTSTNGTPQEGLNVYAFDGNTYVNKTAVTDSAGEASFTLLAGNYRFRVDKDGSQFFSNPSNHCAVPGCTLISAQVTASLSELVLDQNLGACLDNTASINGWDSPGEVTQLNCDSYGISNLAGIENFSSLTDLVLTNNPITLLGALNGLTNLVSLDLSGNSLLECNQLGDLDSNLGIGIVTHPATCLGEGEAVFSVFNPNKTDSNQFSFDVAVTSIGDLVSSAITYNPGTDSFDGRVFVIDSTNGNLILELENPNPSGSDYFGWSVAALSNGDIAVSAWQDQVGAVDAGSVYVFSGIDGQIAHTIENPSPDIGDRFGYSISSSGSDLIIGAPNESGGGAVYVFDSSGNLQQSIPNPTGDTNAEFGRIVASLFGNEIIIGAPKQDVLDGDEIISDAGAVHIFTDLGASILLINNPLPQPDDDFGSNAIALNANELVVSARLTDNFSENDGSIAVFDSTDGSLLWSIANPVADNNGLFGRGLSATSQGHIVVGASNYDTEDVNAGRIYVFDGVEGDLIKIVENPDSSVNANFGRGLAVTQADQIAVGAYGADDGYGELHLFTSVRTGEQFNLLNEQSYASDEERDCVLTIAAANGWATLEEADGFDFGCGLQNQLLDSFAFTDLVNQAPNASVTSDVITLSGFSGTLTAEIAIHTQARSPELSVNGGAFSSNPQSVQSGDSIQARFITPNRENFASVVSVNIGDGLDIQYSDWVVETSQDDNCFEIGDGLFECRAGFFEEDVFQVFGHTTSEDLFVYWDEAASTSTAQPVSGFYLVRNSGGDTYYTIAQDKSIQDATVDGFNLASPLSLDVVGGGDVTGNGAGDLLIEGLDNIPGRKNLLIFGNSSRNTSPIGFAEIDAKLVNFFTDLATYFSLPNRNWTSEGTVDDPDALAIINVLQPLESTIEFTFWDLTPQAGTFFTEIVEEQLFSYLVPGSDLEWFNGGFRRLDGSEPQEFPFGPDGFSDFAQAVGDLYSVMEFGLRGEEGINDIDGDGVENRFDAFPVDPSEQFDFDGDGIGDNADLDDDNDRIPDSFELLYKFNPKDRLDAEFDADGDGTTNLEEFIAGTFPGNGSGGILNEQSLEFMGTDTGMVMAKAERMIPAPVVYVKDIQFSMSAPKVGDPSRVFDSSIGLTYEFVSDVLSQGTARFYIDEGGQLPPELFLTKSFSGGTVSLDSREDFDPPIDDILTEVGSNVPLIDVPVLVEFVNDNDEIVDEFRLLVSVIRLLELEFVNANSPTAPQTNFAHDDDIIARFTVNGVDEDTLNVTRIELDVTYRESESSEPVTWKLDPIDINGPSELMASETVELSSKVYEFTDRLQQAGEYTVLATAVVENFQGEQPSLDRVSAREIVLNITSAPSGDTTETGIDAQYLAFGNGGINDSIYIAKTDAGNNVIGELEFLLTPFTRRSNGIPSYHLVPAPSIDPLTFINSGQIGSITLLNGDINADGLGDLVVRDLPNGAPDAIVFSGSNNAELVYREIDEELINYFRYFDAAVESSNLGRSFLQDFLNGRVDLNGVMVNELAFAFENEIIRDFVSIFDVSAFSVDSNGDLVCDIGIDPAFAAQIARYECYGANLLDTTVSADEDNLTIIRSKGFLMEFVDRNINEFTPAESIVPRIVVVPFAPVKNSIFKAPMVRVRDINTFLPDMVLTNQLAFDFRTLIKDRFAEFFESNLFEVVVGIISDRLDSEIFGSVTQIANPTDLPMWATPPFIDDGSDTIFVLNKILEIISAIHDQADTEIQYPAGSENNPRPIGSIVLNSEPGIFIPTSTGNVTLSCAVPDSEQNPTSCPVNYYWDFLGDGGNQAGGSFETYLYDQPGNYSPQCRIEVACPGGSQWFAQNNDLDVREPLQFGSPNAAPEGIEIGVRNMVAGDPESFYGIEYEKSVAIENTDGFVDLSTLLVQGNWNTDDIEFSVDLYDELGDFQFTYGILESSGFDIDTSTLEFEMASYRVRVKYRERDNIEDHLILVTIPDGTSLTHDQWVVEETNTLLSEQWHDLLPDVYSLVILTGAAENPVAADPEFNASSGQACQSDAWNVPETFPPDADSSQRNYHPGATYEMRSVELTGGYGHQITFDSEGDLITDPMLGAGSADRFAPVISNGFNHRDFDVRPFIQAAQLDGNPVQGDSRFAPLSFAGKIQFFGSHLAEYFQLRPAIIDGAGFLNPGQCQP